MIQKRIYVPIKDFKWNDGTINNRYRFDINHIDQIDYSIIFLIKQNIKSLNY